MIAVNARFLTQELSGVQRYATELSIRLKTRLGKDVIFLAPKNIKMYETAQKLDVITIGEHTGYPWEQWDLPLWLRKHGSPLLLNLANMAPLAYRNKITVVHDLIFLSYGDDNARFRSKLYSITIPIILKTSKHCVTVSEYSMDEISKHYHIPKEKISIVPPAASEKMTQRGIESLREEKYFFCLGSCSRSKNLGFTLESFVRFSVKHPGISLYVGGYDSSAQKFEEKGLGRYVHHPSIRLLGRLSEEELIAYYSNAIAFVFPSLSEGFGIPPLEAQSCGCPVIVSNVTSLPEMYGNSGLTCNPQDLNDLEAKMELTLDKSIRTELIEKGYRNSKRFSWDKSAQALINLMKKNQ